MSSIKRKAPETSLQRRVRPRRESSVELEETHEEPLEETDEEDQEGQSAEDKEDAEEVGLTQTQNFVHC